jgi:hypothetical protein
MAVPVLARTKRTFRELVQRWEGSQRCPPFISSTANLRLNWDRGESSRVYPWSKNCRSVCQHSIAVKAFPSDRVCVPSYNRAIEKFSDLGIPEIFLLPCGDQQCSEVHVSGLCFVLDKSSRVLDYIDDLFYGSSGGAFEYRNRYSSSLDAREESPNTAHPVGGPNVYSLVVGGRCEEGPRLQSGTLLG